MPLSCERVYVDNITDESLHTELETCRLALLPISEFYATLPGSNFGVMEHRTVFEWRFKRDVNSYAPASSAVVGRVACWLCGACDPWSIGECAIGYLSGLGQGIINAGGSQVSPDPSREIIVCLF